MDHYKIMNSFCVEGRRFPNLLHAFTFAQIQSERMDRPVEVHLEASPKANFFGGTRHLPLYHATAYPPSHVRVHRVHTNEPRR